MQKMKSSRGASLRTFSPRELDFIPPAANHYVWEQAPKAAGAQAMVRRPQSVRRVRDDIPTTGPLESLRTVCLCQRLPGGFAGIGHWRPLFVQEEVPRLCQPLQHGQEIPLHCIPNFATIHVLTKISTPGPELESSPRKVFLERGKSRIQIRNKLQPNGELVWVSCLHGWKLVEFEAHRMSSQYRLISRAVTARTSINCCRTAVGTSFQPTG